MPNRAVAGPAAPAWKRVLDQFEEIIACIALAFIVAAVSWGVLTRYVTAQPAAWASEVATLSFAWLVFFGAAACVKYGLHPSIDMLVVRLPKPLQLGVRVFNHTLVLGFCAFMVWFGTRFAIDAWSNPTSVLRIPLTWLYGPVTLAFGFMALRYVQVMLRGTWAIDGERETHEG